MLKMRSSSNVGVQIDRRIAHEGHGEYFIHVSFQRLAIRERVAHELERPAVSLVGTRSSPSRF